jgi:hypothetical protein
MTKEIYIYEKYYNSIRKLEAEERRERLSRICKRTNLRRDSYRVRRYRSNATRNNIEVDVINTWISWLVCLYSNPRLFAPYYILIVY